MKKNITFLFALIGISAIGFSQSTIPNQGFENWEQTVVLDSLQFWTTSTNLYQNQGVDIENAYQVGNAQDANHALHMETFLVNNDTTMGFATINNANDGFVGFPYTDFVDELKGWYKCKTINSDTCMAIVELKKNGSVYSTAMYRFFGDISTWTQFSLPLPLAGNIQPDSVFVGFASSYFLDNDVNEVGNWLEIDNISFDHSGTVTPAPIPNYSFENMIEVSIENPTDWWSFNNASYNQSNSLYATKSTDAASGSSALRIERTQAIDDAGIIPIVSNGVFNMNTGMFNGGVPFIAQPTSFSLEYKYSVSNVDTAFALVNFLKNGLTLNTDSIIVLLPAASWTTKILNPSLSQAPDSVRVSFFAGQNVGSVLLVDDLKFNGGDVSIDENISNSWSIYPNPANYDVSISNSVNSNVSVIDITGKVIFSSANNSEILKVNTENWANGIYFVMVNKKGYTETKKLVIKH